MPACVWLALIRFSGWFKKRTWKIGGRWRGRDSCGVEELRGKEVNSIKIQYMHMWNSPRVNKKQKWLFFPSRPLKNVPVKRKKLQPYLVGFSIYVEVIYISITIKRVDSKTKMSLNCLHFINAYVIKILALTRSQMLRYLYCNLKQYIEGLNLVVSITI